MKKLVVGLGFVLSGCAGMFPTDPALCIAQRAEIARKVAEVPDYAGSQTYWLEYGAWFVSCESIVIP